MSRDLIRLLRQQPTLHRRVRVATAAADMNLSDLAFKAGINVAVLSRGLRERQPFSDDHKRRIADVLGVPVEVIFPAVVRKGAA